MEEISLFKVRRKDCKKGVLAPLLANYFLKKIWSENNTYAVEFLKIAFPSIGSPKLQLQAIPLTLRNCLKDHMLRVRVLRDVHLKFFL